MDYQHASCWRSTQSGWGKAITKKFFTSWPGLLYDLVHKYLYKNNQPYLGTFRNPEKASDQHRKRYSSPNQIQNKTNLVFLKKVDLTGKNYTDQTGRSPVTPNKGNKYILIVYHYDSNTTHAEPLKTRSGLDLKTAYQKLHSLLTNRGLKTHLHIL